LEEYVGYLRPNIVFLFPICKLFSVLPSNLNLAYSISKNFFTIGNYKSRTISMIFFNFFSRILNLVKIHPNHIAGFPYRTPAVSTITAIITRLSCDKWNPGEMGKWWRGERSDRWDHRFFNKKCWLDYDIGSKPLAKLLGGLSSGIDSWEWKISDFRV
jgi:hypothetical protein